ncbi:MAG: TIGR03087 family PEP-CTERM/XrtA system glycosyltransferase [Candidatus Solibacter usitatus]|nr:TIGR03087 family PEP-CTERM/XrtA system glycosyltransferase [Candidatus Solibacter usitatus]
MFDSCSAYQILFLSHCVPNPPDKGERIRSHHEVRGLAERFGVHVVCFARSEEEAAGAAGLEKWCASVHVERLLPSRALARSAVRFALGGCLTTAYFDSAAVRRRIAELRLRTNLAATVVYSSSMAPYAPPDLPLLVDLVDVDSEKWLQYGRERSPGFPYRWEGRRLRRLEVAAAERARCTLLTTEREAAVFRDFAPRAHVRAMENGVDLEYFDPAASPRLPELEGRRFVAFLGAMNYYPNTEAVCRFAVEIYPELRRRDPKLEFFVVGRDPAGEVQRLSGREGITVTGAVPDVRPYVAAARAVVAPIRIARGIQNKALEALAMGKPALVSPAVCAAFGDPLPPGLRACHSAADFIQALEEPPLDPSVIRDGVRRRFDWDRNLSVLAGELDAAVARR